MLKPRKVVYIMSTSSQEYVTDLTDAQWQVVERRRPARRWRRGGPGRPPCDVRLVLNGIFYRAKTGCPWPALPSPFGCWKTVYGSFSRWRRQGPWKRIMDALTQSARPPASPPASSVGGHRGRSACQVGNPRKNHWIRCWQEGQRPQTTPLSGYGGAYPRMCGDRSLHLRGRGLEGIVEPLFRIEGAPPQEALGRRRLSRAGPQSLGRPSKENAQNRLASRIKTRSKL